MHWPINPKVVLGVLVGIAVGMGVHHVQKLLPGESSPTEAPVKTRLLAIRMIQVPAFEADGRIKTPSIPVEIENLSGHAIALPIHDQYRCIVVKSKGEEVLPRKLVPKTAVVTARDFVIIKPNQVKRINFRVKVLDESRQGKLEAVPIVVNVPQKHLSATSWAAVRTKLRKGRAYLWGTGAIHGHTKPLKSP